MDFEFCFGSIEDFKTCISSPLPWLSYFFLSPEVLLEKKLFLVMRCGNFMKGIEFLLVALRFTCRNLKMN
jgi:hypothetical protein